MDIMENPEVPGKIGVQSIPLMVLFKDGQPVAQRLGAAPKSQLKGWIESVI
jgi:thioredoxin 1